MTASYVTLILDVVTAGGAPAGQGTLSIAPSMVLPSPADQMLVSDMPYTARFTGSSFPEVELVASDTIGPQQGNGTPGWTYSFTPDGLIGLTEFSAYVLSAGGATQRLSALAAVPAAQPGSLYYPLAGGVPLEGEISPSVAALNQAGGSVAVNAAVANTFNLTLTASGWAVAAPTSPSDGQVIRFRITQGTGGFFMLSWNAVFDFGSGAAPVLSTAAGKVDIVAFEYIGTLSKWAYLGAGLGY